MKRATFLNVALAFAVAGCTGGTADRETNTSDPRSSPVEPGKVSSERSSGPVATTSPSPAARAATESSKLIPKDFGSPRKPGAATPPVMATEWHATKASATELARMMDARLMSLRGVKLDANYVMELPTGNGGGRSSAEIRDLDTFNARVPALRRGVPYTAIVRANGKQVARLDEGRPINPGQKVSGGTMKDLGWKEVRRAGAVTKGLEGNAMLASWPESLTQDIFIPVIERRGFLESLIRAMERGDEGYHVRVEERESMFAGQKVKSLRIVGERDARAEQKFGPGRVEIVLDARIHLPVTIIAAEKPIGAERPTRVYWTAKWLNHQTFKDETFKLPSS